jgi:hypothetical protein
VGPCTCADAHYTFNFHDIITSYPSRNATIALRELAYDQVTQVGCCNRQGAHYTLGTNHRIATTCSTPQYVGNDTYHDAQNRSYYTTTGSSKFGWWASMVLAAQAPFVLTVHVQLQNDI